MITSLSDENQNLQKHRGCMNRIFQFLDRHHFLNGRSHSNKKPLPGSNYNVELACAKETAHQQNQEIGNEKQRTSTSSSKAMLTQHQDSPIPLGHSSPDIRDVVKHAMHREARGVSIKKAGREENTNYVVKYIDSPRPLHNPKSWKPGGAGFDGSTQSQTKYLEALRIAKEEMDISGRGRLKDPPRFSYDSRELREGTRSSVKIKEHQRLSLDSRDTRGRQAFASTPTRERGLHSQTHEPCNNKRSSVIAMLMGLEPFPDNPVADQSKKTTSNGDAIRRSSVSLDLNLPNNRPVSPGTSKSNFGRKPGANLRLPLEQAPWRQQNANREPQNLSGENKEDPDKGSHASSTIYDQIEKRITENEFKGSGEDVRALKKILEAMQKTRFRLENQQREVDLKLMDKTTGVDSLHKQIGRDQTLVRSTPQQPGWRSPHEENKIKGRLLNTPQLSKETRHRKEQNFTVPTKSSRTVSPQTRQKKHVMEKKNHNNSSSSDLHMERAKSTSPNRKPKVKASYLQGQDRKYKLNRVMRDGIHQDDAASLLSERNNSSASQMGTGFTRTYSYENGCNRQGGYKNRLLAVRLRNNTPIGELMKSTGEQPSPNSVLDTSFYREDSPSPVKKIPTPFTDNDSLDSDDEERGPEIQDHSQETSLSNRSVESYDKNMEDTRSLVHKVDQLNKMTHEATTDHIDSLFNNMNQDHRYITKILLVSGLLKNTSFLSTPTQLQSNGHVINPKLFHFLEQTHGQNEVSGKTSKTKVHQKIQRKIVFDTVNEILAQKLDSERTSPHCLISRSSIELLKEIHLEIECLQKLSFSSDGEDEDHDQVLSIITADMAHQSEGWKDYSGEMQSLVLGIERLIFKDLITEAINDEITGNKKQNKNSKKS